MQRVKYEPMLLTRVDLLPDSPDMIYQQKHDGNRGIAYVHAGRIVIRSKTSRPVTDEFPGIVADLPAALQGHEAVLDGEIVAYDTTGRERRTWISKRGVQLVFQVFDLLHLDEEPQIGLPLTERQEKLDSLIVPQDSIQVVSSLDDRNTALMRAIEYGHEGVVAKRKGSRYAPGRRNNDWLKQTKGMST
jgi:bifunctional non-homologous end joining protein LigD